MAEDIISIFAPLLSSDVTVEDALASGRAANSLAVVEEREGAFRLHPIDTLESAAQHLGPAVRLGSLTGRDVKLNRAEPIQEDDAGTLRRLRVDVAIQAIMPRANGPVARIVGFIGPDTYLPQATSTTWYECRTTGCTDRTRYRSSGKCAYKHTLVKRPP
jgi:hypothetical protein